MIAPTRLIAAVLLVGATSTTIALTQPPATPPQGQTAAPAPQGPPPQGGRGDATGGRRGGFTQFTRPLAPEDVILRGKALYETNCASCHASDLRGTADGRHPNLLRSGVALRDQHGELIGARLARHTPPITLIETDSVAVADYIHSVHATMGGQGSPPGRFPANLNLNVLVGDPEAGEATFKAVCGSCHSVAGDLQGIGSMCSDPRALQNAWVSGSKSAGGGRGGGRGGAGGTVPAIITLADGSKLEGTLVRADDFLVVLLLPDGTRKSMARVNGVPRVEITDPRAGHVDAIVKLAHEDRQNRMLHDITAYLCSIK